MAFGTIGLITMEKALRKSNGKDQQLRSTAMESRKGKGKSEQQVR